MSDFIKNERIGRISLEHVNKETVEKLMLKSTQNVESETPWDHTLAPSITTCATLVKFFKL